MQKLCAHRVSVAPDAKLAHLNRKPNTCHSAKKRKSLSSHSDTLQRRSKEAYNKLRVWQGGDFPFDLGTGRWRRTDESCDSPPFALLIGLRSKTDTGQGDYFELFPNSLRVSGDIPSQYLIVLSQCTFECVIIVRWVDFFSNKEIKWLNSFLLVVCLNFLNCFGSKKVLR